MIILVSADFAPLAQALHELYREPIVEFFQQPNWLHDLRAKHPGKFITRLSIIGHSDSFYGEDQSFFGGNPHERVMLIEEFSHSLITLLKYNERLVPGFCKHLKHIDLIDCHLGERKFIAKLVAEYFHADDYLRAHASHLRISSFANSHHLKIGTALVTHPDDDHILSFYTFKSNKYFLEYKTVHQKLAELSEQLHHLEQMPGHTTLLSNGKSRNATIQALEKKCHTLQKKEQKLLKDHTDKTLHISDPRRYLDHHPSCQIEVSHVTTRSKHTEKKSHTHATTRPPKLKTHFFAKNAAPNPSQHTQAEDQHRLHTKKSPSTRPNSRHKRS